MKPKLAQIAENNRIQFVSSSTRAAHTLTRLSKTAPRADV